MHELIYVGDPMCSWCWGFSPVLDAVREKYRSQFSIRVVVGGLRPGPGAEKLDARLKKTLKTEWEKIQKVTGQPFDTVFLDRDNFLYDTHPAACAIVAMRHLKPDAELDFFQAVQQAFYARGVDVTRSANYEAIVKPFGVEFARFAESMKSEKTTQEAVADYKTAHTLGVRGFPSLLMRHGDHVASIAKGYLPFNGVEPLLDKIAGKPK